MIEKEVQVRFREIDSAKIMYFGTIFDLAHDLYEAFIQSLGISYPDWFQNPKIAVPIVHAEANFHKPLLGGITYLGQTQVTKLGETSFSLEHRFEKAGELHAVVHMTHVYLNTETGNKEKLPEWVRTIFSKHLS